MRKHSTAEAVRKAFAKDPKAAMCNAIIEATRQGCEVGGDCASAENLGRRYVAMFNLAGVLDAPDELLSAAMDAADDAHRNLSANFASNLRHVEIKLAAALRMAIEQGEDCESHQRMVATLIGSALADLVLLGGRPIDLPAGIKAHGLDPAYWQSVAMRMAEAKA
jgi:hypothetical protein